MGAPGKASAGADRKSKKRSSKSQDVSASKRQRVDEKKPAAESKNKTSTERNLPAASILQEERKPFARGGGGVLSPFELKNIQRQAKQDVMFEETGQKPAQEQFDSEDEEMADPEEKPRHKSDKRKVKAKPKKVKEVKELVEERIRVQGLTPKRMSPGDTVLGRVSRVSQHEVVLDLPNNLSGHVTANALSAKLSSRIADMRQGHEDLSDDEEGDEDGDVEKDIDLRSMFVTGQYLRAALLEDNDPGTGSKTTKSRRTHFSLDPRLTNKGIAASNIPVNTAVMAAVKSVEDHGLVMDLGFGEGDARGFLSSREIPEGMAYDQLQEGAVFLCLVTGATSNGKVIKLSANHKKIGDTKKGNVLTEASTVGSFLPGCVAEMMVSDVTDTTVAGKILGSVNTTVDVLHSGAHFDKVKLNAKYPVGSKLKGRIIFACGDEGHRTLGMSLLRHAVSLSAPTVSSLDKSDAQSPLEIAPIGSILDEVKVVQVEPVLGLYVEFGVRGLAGFVHISRISDSKVKDLEDDSSRYKVGSIHKARVLGYNSLDNLLLMSMEQSTLEQPFVRVEDVPVGQLVKGTVDQILVKKAGVVGVLLNLANDINGFVPEVHMSDIHLQHPERKFRPGVSFPARVLAINLQKRRVRLTLKKSLVSTELGIWTAYSDIKAGDQGAGTIVKLTRAGAILEFYGKVRAFLPASQMSDTFIEDPTSHFQLGQVLRVRAVAVDAEASRMTVSCRLAADDEEGKAAAFKQLKLGQIVSGTISSKSADDVTIDLSGSELSGVLRIGQFSDGSSQKNASIMKNFRIGQSLSDLLIIELFPGKKSVMLSNKSSLLKAAKSGDFTMPFDQITKGATMAGFVRNVTNSEVFIQTSGHVGLLPLSQLSPDRATQQNFGYQRDDTVSAKVLSIDHAQQRFVLTMKELMRDRPEEPNQTLPERKKGKPLAEVVNPVDGSSQSMSDFALGKITKAKITSIKETQLNVQLADNIQGRIDISEAFNSWEDIKDRRDPLNSFHQRQVLSVRIIGLHDARNHRFLPLSHRATTMAVFELSLRLDQSNQVMSYDQLTVGSSHIAFVNSAQSTGLWVNISPQVRGRIARLDASDDVSSLNDLPSSFPPGFALRTRVKAVDPDKGHLDLTATTRSVDSDMTIEDVSIGSILAARITKISERTLTLQLGKTVVGQVGLTEMADDFEQADPSSRKKDEIVRAAVLDVDAPNKKVSLSVRPSKTISSSLPVKDQSISNISQLKVGDILRGFIKNVADVGLFISIGFNLTAFVRVSDLSDSFVKEWKSQYEIDRLVSGRITAIDETTNKVQMSLKASVILPDYVAPLAFNDLKVGQVVSGKVRKVEDFGAFVVVDNSQNVSGLCHRSEIADHRVADVRKLYSEGDAVKAVVLKIEPEKRRISFGLKASYFNVESQNEDSDEDMDGGVGLTNGDADSGSDGGDVDLLDVAANTGDMNRPDEEEEEDDDDQSMSDEATTDMAQQDSTKNGIDPGGFDWDGRSRRAEDTLSDEDHDTNRPAKSSKKKGVNIQIDRTAALNDDPKTTSDFERLLLTDRDNSTLWMQYMAYHLGLGEIEEARAIAERALREININEQGEKQNIWVAWLNLEIEQGSQDAVDVLFKRACESQDKVEMHEKLASIYISLGKSDETYVKKADEVYQDMIKRKLSTSSPRFWTNYAHFLLTETSTPPPAREWLNRAMQSVPQHAHLDLIKSFALLQFKTAKNGAGNPELGRTIYEDLLKLYPKRGDLWDVFLEVEMAQMESAQGSKEDVRRLFERMVSVKGLKARRAKFVFKRWLEWEQKHGGPKMVEKVKARTVEWVKQKREEGEAAEDDN